MGQPSVERREGLYGREFASEYSSRGRPVVLTDALRGLGCANWSFDLLRRRYGELPVSLDDGRTLSLAALLEEVAASRPSAPGPYLRELAVEEAMPALLADLLPLPGRGPDWLACRFMPRWRYYRNGHPELLIAGAGTRFPVLHFDLWHTHAFILQIVGDKRFWLYPPEQTPWLYPRADQGNLSAIDGFDPVDLERFPLYRRAQPVELIVRAGETLFVPAGWWHRTQIVSASLAVTVNSVDRSNWTAFARDYVGATRETRPLRSVLKRVYMRVLGVGLRLRDATRDVMRDAAPDAQPLYAMPTTNRSARREKRPDQPPPQSIGKAASAGDGRTARTRNVPDSPSDSSQSISTASKSSQARLSVY
jgi:hypothetical protein